MPNGTKTWNPAGTSKWSTEGSWTPSGKPAATDEVFLPTGTGSCEVGSTAAKAASFIAEAYEKTLSFTTGKIAVGGGESGAGNVAIKLGTGMTVSGTSVFSLAGTTTNTEKLYFAGKTISELGVSAGATSKWKLEEALKTSIVSLTKGELNTSGQEVVASTRVESTGTATRALTLGASTVKVEGEGTVWEFGTTTGLTFSGASSTIQINSPGPEAQPKFVGGGLTYGTLTCNSEAVRIKENNTFGTLKIDRVPVPTVSKGKATGTTLEITSGTNPILGQEITATNIAPGSIVVEVLGGGKFTLSKAVEAEVPAGSTIEILTSGVQLEVGSKQAITAISTAASSGHYGRLAGVKTKEGGGLEEGKAKIKIAGRVSLDWLRIKDIAVETSTEFYAGANSVDLGGNEGIKFEAAPAEGLANAQSMIL